MYFLQKGIVEVFFAKIYKKNALSISLNYYGLLLCNGSTYSWLWRLGLYLRPVYKDFNHRYPKLTSENRWRLYIKKNGSSIEDSGSVTPCPGAPPQAASLCSAARAGRLRDRVQTEPLSSILPSWTGIVDSSQKIKTNSDPSVNRSKREPYKRSAGRYCFATTAKRLSQRRCFAETPHAWKASSKNQNKQRPECHRIFTSNCCLQKVYSVYPLLAVEWSGISAHTEADSPRRPSC